MWLDLRKQLKFQEEISHTSLRPDIVLWSKGTKQVVLIELTVPWEERMEEAHERKLKKYQALIFKSQQNGKPGTFQLKSAAGASQGSRSGEHLGCSGKGQIESGW
ncbi:hypothetical protein N1851_026903 [Merluccius polli]|uniref:Uncharacterized protein n=1 Tax=Merluccius polli TaxID=89951 RepID=A0AA47NSL0_MERPO|nr:hypothetical protein N1851_026903 [Merluccius polli]